MVTNFKIGKKKSFNLPQILLSRNIRPYFVSQKILFTLKKIYPIPSHKMKNLSTPLNVQFWAKNLLKKYLWRNESLHITHVNCTNVQMVEFWKRNFKNDAIGKYLYVWRPSINDVTHFLRFLTPPSSLVTHFTK